MFCRLTLLVVAIGAAVGDFRECMERAQTECVEPPEDFPTSPEELRRDCDTLQDSVKCMKGIFEDCPEAWKEALEATTISMYLEDTCDENGNTYQVLFKHISCAGPLFNDVDDICPATTMSEEEEEVLGPVLNAEENADLLICGYFVRKIMCSSIAISKHCGAELKDVMTDLQKKYNLMYVRQCTSDKLRRLEPYMEDYENVLMQKEFEF